MRLKSTLRKTAAFALAAMLGIPTVLANVQPTKAWADTTSTSATYHQVVTSPANAKAGDLFVAPNGTGDGSSEASPMDFVTALTTVSAGNTIWVKAGTYSYTELIMIAEDNAGSADAYKTIVGYGGDVVIDFSAMELVSSNRGIVLDGSYWHIYGLIIKGAGDNGMLLSGDNNIVEMCVFTENRDTGLQLSRYNTSYGDIAQWPTNNLIKNCTSFNNSDKSGENADGFAAKLTCGEGNVFDGCMAYNNSDDGWDLYAKTSTGPIGVVTIKNSIAFRNGKLTTGAGSASGDMNGFKLGGSGIGTPHVIYNCIAFENGAHGFTDNNNPTALTMKNCTAFNNSKYDSGKSNFMMSREKDGINSNLLSYTTSKIGTDAFIGTVAYSVYYNNKPAYYSVTASTAFDGKEKLGTIVTLSDSDFVSLTAPDTSTYFHTAWRDADGTINTHGFLEVAQTSSLTTMADDGKVLGARFAVSSGSVEAPTQKPTESATQAPTQNETQGATQAPTQKPTETVTQAPVDPYKYTLDISAGLVAGQTYGKEGIADITVLADMPKSDATVSYKFDGVEYTNYIQGKDNPSPNKGKIPEKGAAFKIDAKTTGKITFVLNQAANKTYHFVKKNADGSPSDLASAKILETGAYTFDVEAGTTYYFYADGSKPMVYTIVLSNTDVAETPSETATQAPTEKPSEAGTQAPSETPSETQTQASTEKPSEPDTQAPGTGDNSAVMLYIMLAAVMAAAMASCAAYSHKKNN